MASSNSFDDLITDLQRELENAIDWFCSKEMVVNLDKFQSIIINRLVKLNDSYKVLIDNHKINSANSETLLGIDKDNKLNFEKHVTAQYQKAAANEMPWHAYISTLDFRAWHFYLILSNFHYFLLVWHFCSTALSQKTEKTQEGV